LFGIFRATPNLNIMTTQEQETKAILDDVLSRWAPFPMDPIPHQMMRALLQLAAYEKDCERIRNGERPIRTSYPIPLPNAVALAPPPQGLASKKDVPGG
jgi:hypothetical protein